ncbi:hypothetical protein MCEMIH15_01344 [Caulobacteraceae bacterium]
MTTGLKTRSPHGRTNVGNLVGGHPPNCLTSPTILTHHKQTIPAEAKAESGDLIGLCGMGSGTRLTPSGMTMRGLKGPLGKGALLRAMKASKRARIQIRRAAPTIRWPSGRKVRRRVLSLSHHWLTGRVASVTFVKYFGQDCPKELRTNTNWLSIRLGV